MCGLELACCHTPTATQNPDTKHYQPDKTSGCCSWPSGPAGTEVVCCVPRTAVTLLRHSLSTASQYQPNTHACTKAPMKLPILLNRCTWHKTVCKPSSTLLGPTHKTLGRHTIGCTQESIKHCCYISTSCSVAQEPWKTLQLCFAIAVAAATHAVQRLPPMKSQ